MTGDQWPVPESPLLTVTPGVLTVGVLPNISPSSYYEGGELRGYDVDIATGIARELGLRPDFRPIDPSSLLRELAAGTLDLVAAQVSYTPARAEKYAFADPYLTTYLFFYAAPGRRIRRSGLRRGKIGVIRGSIHEEHAKEVFPEAEIVPIAGAAEVFGGQLLSGTLDVVLVDHVFSPYPLKLGFQVIAAVEGPPAGCVLRKDAVALMAAVNAAQGRMRRRGDLLRALDRYELLPDG